MLGETEKLKAKIYNENDDESTYYRSMKKTGVLVLKLSMLSWGKNWKLQNSREYSNMGYDVATNALLIQRDN